MQSAVAIAHETFRSDAAPVRLRAIPAPSAATPCPSACSSCGVREICLPFGLTDQDMDRVDELVYARRTVKRGQNLYHVNDNFTSLYALRSGSFKMKLMLADGREQVVGFAMAGEILGMEGIATGIQTSDAVALEDSVVCAIPYARLQALGQEIPSVQQWLYRAMSSAIVREQNVMMLLGSMRAEERLATFLLNLSQRFSALGFSKMEFNLRMTRGDIGSFLGLKLETVSRLFSRFQDMSLIEVQVRRIRILDLPGLRALLGERIPAL